jgi:hypothetical protein
MSELLKLLEEEERTRHFHRELSLISTDPLGSKDVTTGRETVVQAGEAANLGREADGTG